MKIQSVTPADHALVARVLRLRAIVRRQAARSASAFDALVTLDVELASAGGTAHGNPQTVNGHIYWALFLSHAQPGESFSHTVEKDPAEPLHVELGERCAAALNVWRRRAIKMTRVCDALDKAARELSGEGA